MPGSMHCTLALHIRNAIEWTKVTAEGFFAIFFNTKFDPRLLSQCICMIGIGIGIEMVIASAYIATEIKV